MLQVSTDNLPEMTASAKIIIWILAGALGLEGAVTLPAIAYFLVREFNRKDRVEDKTEAFNTTIGEVKDMVHETKLMVAEVRSWSAEKFVGRPEFDREVKRLEEEDKGMRDDVKSAFDSCKECCPARTGKFGGN
jgi:hypothetical protein